MKQQMSPDLIQTESIPYEFEPFQGAAKPRSGEIILSYGTGGSAVPIGSVACAGIGNYGRRITEQAVGRINVPGVAVVEGFDYLQAEPSGVGCQRLIMGVMTAVSNWANDIHPGGRIDFYGESQQSEGVFWAKLQNPELWSGETTALHGLGMYPISKTTLGLGMLASGFQRDQLRSAPTVLRIAKDAAAQLGEEAVKGKCARLNFALKSSLGAWVDEMAQHPDFKPVHFLMAKNDLLFRTNKAVMMNKELIDRELVKMKILQGSHSSLATWSGAKQFYAALQYIADYKANLGLAA